MQHRTVALVGDSLGRQQFQSLMCMVTGGKDIPEVVDVGSEYGLVKAAGGEPIRDRKLAQIGDAKNFAVYSVIKWCDNTIPLAGGDKVSQDESVVAGAVKGTGVRLLDITALSQLREEGHISQYSLKASDGVQDCLHWCLPGIPDTWNEILYAQLKKIIYLETLCAALPYLVDRLPELEPSIAGAVSSLGCRCGIEQVHTLLQKDVKLGGLWEDTLVLRLHTTVVSINGKVIYARPMGIPSGPCHSYLY
ncbi:hypothetical protein MRB53_023238 [Persea americana]|uniref:Uncharacterized protein n=1 Tax=Persea americana TaxID=3435 RepID=A0ACC2L9H9_PERAE|nr:hypothetical protein MRB53_023238 [Persea americana]